MGPLPLTPAAGDFAALTAQHNVIPLSVELIADGETPIGALPQLDDLNLDGLHLDDEAGEKLFGFDRAGWRAEFASIGEFLDEYGPRMPAMLKAEQARILGELDG